MSYIRKRLAVCPVPTPTTSTLRGFGWKSIGMWAAMTCWFLRFSPCHNRSISSVSKPLSRMIARFDPTPSRKSTSFSRLPRKSAGIRVPVASGIPIQMSSEMTIAVPRNNKERFRSSHSQAANPVAKLTPVMNRRLIFKPNAGRHRNPITSAPKIPPRVLIAAIRPVPILAVEGSFTTIRTARGNDAPERMAAGRSRRK